MIGAVSEQRLLDPNAIGDYVDRLYRAAWGLCGSREDAEDLVQETYAKVLAKPRFLRNDDDLGYLLRVLRNTFVSRHRASTRRPATTAMPETFEPVDHSIGSRPEAAFGAREVFTHISALPEAFRDALVAVDVVTNGVRVEQALLAHRANHDAMAIVYRPRSARRRPRTA